MKKVTLQIRKSKAGQKCWAEFGAKMRLFRTQATTKIVHQVVSHTRKGELHLNSLCKSDFNETQLHYLTSHVFILGRGGIRGFFHSTISVKHTHIGIVSLYFSQQEVTFSPHYPRILKKPSHRTNYIQVLWLFLHGRVFHVNYPSDQLKLSQYAAEHLRLGSINQGCC